MKNILFYLVLLLGCFQIYGQTFSGRIYTGDDQLPAPFTTLYIEHSGLGTVSDQDGNFKIDIPPALAENVLTISFIGYLPQNISIKDLRTDSLNVFILEKDITGLKEVVLTSKKKTYKPLQLLKKSLKHIEENYSTDTVSFDGYYREMVSENGKYIKYSDAICEFNYAPYREKKYKRTEYFNDWLSVSLSDIPSHWGERFHRGHYPTITLKGDKARIIAARSSSNLSDKGQSANIEGGPLGVLGKDRVKFRQLFTKKNNFKKYTYTLSEKLDSTTQEWDYVVSFYPTKFVEDSIPKNKRALYKLNKNNLSGQVTIDRNTFAIKCIEYSVPKELRHRICTYKSMNLKHFDYRVKTEYSFVNGKYYISYAQLQDEFVFTDTVTNTRTAYNSTSELKIYNINPKKVHAFKSEDLFANTDANQLYDFAVDYDSLLWSTYLDKHPEYAIPKKVRLHMEEKKPLEKQFVDKHKRDLSLPPPLARESDYTYTIHGETIADEYDWLKDTKDPKHNIEVMDYIQAENAYFDNYVTPLRQHQRELFKELKSYQATSKESLPYKENGYFYYSKLLEGNDYYIHYRKKEGSDVEEELLNVQELSANHVFYQAGVLGVSPNNKVMAYGENTTGKDGFVTKFKNLETQKILADSLQNIGDMIWISDSSFLYTVREPKTYRVGELRYHKLFDDSSNDELVYREEDLRSSVSIYKSSSKELIFLICGNSISSEIHFMRMKDENHQFQVIYPREENHIYGISHVGDQFYIMTNKKAINQKLVKVDTANYAQKHWVEVLPHQDNVTINNFKVFKNHLVYVEEENAQARLMIKNFETGKTHQVKINEDYYSISLYRNSDFDTDSLRYLYTSFETPTTIMSYHMDTKEERVVKEEEIGEPYKNGYLKVKRVWATARDGEKVPITLFYDRFRYRKKGWSSRMLLTSYGSYGMSQGVHYQSDILPLLKRGFIYAIAHIRGGRDLGQHWHDDGKMLNKMNTFTDFIDCTEFLIEEGYTKKGEVTIEGGSAGGLLMGAVSNMRPDLYKAVVLNVPFVDVINTMLDDKLPLTTGEYLEWGNPNKKRYFKYMRSYSPYDNVKAQDYPPMFFFTGLNDTRVGYWEPAKMVARLRKMKTDDQVLLLKTNINAGHGGGSGAYSYLKDRAMKYAMFFELYRKDTYSQ